MSVNGSEVAAGVYGAADEALGDLDHLVTRLEVRTYYVCLF